MVSRGTTTRIRPSGNGRTPAENAAYASIGAHGQSRQMQLENAERMRRGRREAARKRIIARDGQMSDQDM
jgi:hypothetical protein